MKPERHLPQADNLTGRAGCVNARKRRRGAASVGELLGEDALVPRMVRVEHDDAGCLPVFVYRSLAPLETAQGSPGAAWGQPRRPPGLPRSFPGTSKRPQGPIRNAPGVSKDSPRGNFERHRPHLKSLKKRWFFVYF